MRQIFDSRWHDFGSGANVREVYPGKGKNDFFKAFFLRLTYYFCRKTYPSKTVWTKCNACGSKPNARGLTGNAANLAKLWRSATKWIGYVLFYFYWNLLIMTVLLAFHRHHRRPIRFSHVLHSAYDFMCLRQLAQIGRRVAQASVLFPRSEMRHQGLCFYEYFWATDWNIFFVDLLAIVRQALRWKCWNGWNEQW